GIALSLHWVFHLVEEMERASSDSFLRFLPGVLHFLFFPLQREAGRVRLRSVLGWDRGQTSGADAAAAFCAGFSGTIGTSFALRANLAACVLGASGAALSAFSCGERESGIRSVARRTSAAGQDRTWLFRVVLPDHGTGFLLQL